MDVVWILAGALLVLVGFLDVVFTVLYYDEAGILSVRLYRLTWTVVRSTTRGLPQRVRSVLLSLGIPFMVLGTLVLWLGLVIVGFALMYHVGMHQGAFDMRPGLDASFGRALYLSGVSISTLGYGDVTPATGFYQTLTFLQALMGFTILTLAIAYVLNIYQTLRQTSGIGADLYHQAGDSFDVLAIMRSHFPDGRPREIGGRLMTLHRALVDHYEGMRHYPIIYYFHSSRVYPTIPYVLAAIGELTAALRWGLPKDHAASRDPWLPALIASLSSIGLDLEERLLGRRYRVGSSTAPPVVGEEGFRLALERIGPQDPWVERFIALDRAMRVVARIPMGPDPLEAYARYVRWLPNAHRVETLVNATARDLGYDPSLFRPPWHPEGPESSPGTPGTMG